jgi:hypothetical protein
MRDNADFIPFCARRNSISAQFHERFLPLQKYSILAPLSTATPFLLCPDR